MSSGGRPLSMAVASASLMVGWGLVGARCPSLPHPLPHAYEQVRAALPARRGRHDPPPARPPPARPASRSPPPPPPRGRARRPPPPPRRRTPPRRSLHRALSPQPRVALF